MELEKDHEFCLRCGRKLKNPDMRKLGYGAVCYKKSQVENGNPLFNVISRGEVKNIAGSRKNLELGGDYAL